MSNQSWNDSTLSFGGNGVTPLIDLHQPNQPADFDTTGSEDTTHLHGTGLPKNSFTASFLGSKCPIAGTVCAVASTIKGGAADTTKTYGQALISQMNISGRKDGRIEGSLTAMPADSSLTATTHTWTIGDLGFNGSTFSFAGTPFTLIQSISYASSATPIECTGAEGSDNLYAPGLPDETLTVTTLGGPQCAAKAKGASVVAWKDGGTIGTSAGSYTVQCMSTNPGGSLDGQTTTEHVFKMSRTA